MKKIIYIANIRLPTEKAHGIQIMKMCESFACAGVHITLVVPWRKNNIKENPFEYYRVDKIFSIKKLFSLDLVFLGKIGFWIQSFSFALLVFIFALIKISKGERVIYYSRDEIPLFFLSLIGQKIVWEAHMGQMNSAVKFIIGRASPIVAVTQGLKNLYASKGRGSILVAPDGVDIGQFQISRDRNEIRSQLGLPLHKNIILYEGHLYMWKGAHTLAEAAPQLGEDTEVVFVGGTDKDITNFREKYSSIENIKIIGRKPHHEIPPYLKAADILVIPNSAQEDISRLYTSPMKLFEYMASGTPIVASNLPSLKEILNDGNACFFEPDNSASLAYVVRNLLDDKEKQICISKQASHDIMRYSWDGRAQQIITFIYHV